MQRSVIQNWKVTELFDIVIENLKLDVIIKTTKREKGQCPTINPPVSTPASTQVGLPKDLSGNSTMLTGTKISMIAMLEDTRISRFANFNG
jgi:hypothetical protein